MTMKSKLNGILPALVTPLHEDLTLNVPVLERLVERLYDAQVDGLYLCGSTGEGLLLPSDMRRRIVEIVSRNSPRGKQVIVHVGAWCFDEAQALAKHAAQHGAAAISSLPPVGASYGELVRHYRDLAASTDVPFLAYYFPALGSGPLSLDQLREICALPNVAGLKFTDYDLYTLSLLTREGNVVYNGRDEVLSAGLLMGASGGIGSIYNIVPEWFVDLYRHARAGHWAESRAVQDQINDLIAALLHFPFMPSLKRTMTWLGFDSGPAMRPRIALTGEQESKLRAALEPVLLNRPDAIVVRSHAT
jgi:N-acetylneuraminate lyase